MSRWIDSSRRVYADSLCQLCGTYWGGYRNRMCPRTTCLACGTPQCMVNGLGNGRCPLCSVGLLPGWSGTNRQCERKDCQQQAVMVVANAYVCMEHGRTRKVRVALARVIAPATVEEAIRRVQERRGEEWVEVSDDGCEVIAT